METNMKVKTNLRAGKQNRKGSDNTLPEDTSGEAVVYYPPVTRCVGI
jgi:hypothetical protein